MIGGCRTRSEAHQIIIRLIQKLGTGRTHHPPLYPRSCGRDGSGLGGRAVIRSPRRAPWAPGSFPVAGTPLDFLYPHRVAVTWSKGRLSGNPATVAAALARAF